jgi:hypothetical protein
LGNPPVNEQLWSAAASEARRRFPLNSNQILKSLAISRLTPFPNCNEQPDAKQRREGGLGNGGREFQAAKDFVRRSGGQRCGKRGRTGISDGN